MKWLGCGAFALLALGTLGGCSESNELGSWKVVAGKDKITDAERYSLVSEAEGGRSALVITCTNTESPIFMLMTKDRLGYSPGIWKFDVRAGSKAAISQTWTAGDRTASPERPYLGFELVDYVGVEKTLIMRAQGERGRFDYTFDVNGIPAAFAKMKDVCKRQAAS